MKKLLAPQLVVFLFCAFVLSASAQDSAKKASPAKAQVAKPSIKPPAGYAAKPAGYYKSRYYRKPGDTTHAYPRPMADTAQKAAVTDVASDKSLSGQYQYLLTKVYYYQQPLLNAFHKSIMDTLWQARGALKTS